MKSSTLEERGAEIVFWTWAVVALIVIASLGIYRLSLFLRIPPIQPRNFAPKAGNDCDIWPAQAAICEASDGHVYIAGARFDHLSSLLNCAFRFNEDWTWTVSDNGGEGCMVNGKHFKQGRGPEDYGVRQ